jgi:hypothetical protein
VEENLGVGTEFVFVTIELWDQCLLHLGISKDYSGTDSNIRELRQGGVEI